MSLKKAIEHGKEHRKINVGHCLRQRCCDWCLMNVYHKHAKKMLATPLGIRKKYPSHHMVKFYDKYVDITELEKEL